MLSRHEARHSVVPKGGFGLRCLLLKSGGVGKEPRGLGAGWKSSALFKVLEAWHAHIKLLLRSSTSLRASCGPHIPNSPAPKFPHLSTTATATRAFHFPSPIRLIPRRQPALLLLPKTSIGYRITEDRRIRSAGVTVQLLLLPTTNIGDGITDKFAEPAWPFQNWRLGPVLGRSLGAWELGRNPARFLRFWRRGTHTKPLLRSLTSLLASCGPHIPSSPAPIFFNLSTTAPRAFHFPSSKSPPGSQRSFCYLPPRYVIGLQKNSKRRRDRSRSGV